MSSAPSLQVVLDRLRPNLMLEEVASAHTDAARLPSAPAGDQPTLIGHLNLVQPNHIQVLGRTEVHYWAAREDSERAHLMAQLFNAELHCLIVASGLEPPADIAARAHESGVPLLRAGVPCERVIRALRHEFAHEFAARTVLHGVFLDVLGVGVLLSGESSVGKSELALELLSRGHSLVADDAPEFRSPAPGTVEGSAPAVLQDFLEVGGLGVLNIRAMYGDAAIRMQKRLQLIVHLEPLTSALRGQLDRLNGNLSQTEILGTPIDTMTLPVATGRNLAVLAEAAVRNFLLLRRGYDATEDLMQRQTRAMQENDPCD